MILLIDNYDSFVHNLARYFRLLGQATLVARNDEITVDGARKLAPDAVVISPGPGGPDDAGVSLDLVRGGGSGLPILGVCLGHQVIAAACGGRVIRAAEPMHGRSSWIHHDAESIFKDLPDPFPACRYHSLEVERTSLPEELAVTAWTEDGSIMGLRHRYRPVVGLQFHPESVLTEVGLQLCQNFLERVCKLSVKEPVEA